MESSGGGVRSLILVTYLVAMLVTMSVMNSATAGALSRASLHSPEIKFLAASAIPSQPLETILTSTPTQFPSPLRNFKLSVVFNRPLQVSQVHLESCVKDWSDGIQIFTSPGLGRIFIEGGKKSFDAKLDSRFSIESVAIVFAHDSEICLKNLKFLDAKAQPIALSVTSLLEAKVNSEKAETIFDSHPETLLAVEDPIVVTFREPQTFDRAVAWTGGSTLYAHSLKLISENGWAETIPLRQSSSDQEVIFKKPFTGKQLTIEAPDAGFIGELRFANGTKVASIRYSQLNAYSELKKKFEEASLNRTLDFDWVTSEEDNWTFLFRPDGTFFIRGYNDNSKQAKRYAAVGGYTVVRQEKNKLRMKINGVRFSTGLPWDGVSCPFACGTEGDMEGALPLSDTLVLEKLDEGTLIVRNRTPRPQRTITFGDLKVHRAVDD